MNIKQFSKDELFERIRKVKLRGHGQPEIYKDAHLVLACLMVVDIVPAQTYTLKKQVELICGLRRRVDAEGQQIDLFNLDGFVEIDGVPFLPPIVETSVTKSGRDVLLLNDGMHRVMAAADSEGAITCVVASGLPKEYPYYAWPLENDWAGVEMVDVRPEVKKDYREADYKALFRDFNAQFPGVQADRSKVAA